jgi:hypothetical protein
MLLQIDRCPIPIAAHTLLRLSFLVIIFDSAGGKLLPARIPINN